MARKLTEQQSSDAAGVPGVNTAVKTTPIESEVQKPSNSNDPVVHGVGAAIKMIPTGIEVQEPCNSNDPAVDIEELSLVAVPLNEFHVHNDDDNIYSNDTVIQIEEEPSFLAQRPLSETHLATGGNDNNVNNIPAGEISSSWIRRWLDYYIPNLRVNTAITLGNLILKLMVNCETDLGEMLLCCRLGNVRLYRLPLSYSVSTSWNNIGIVPPRYYTTFPIHLNLQFGIAVEYRHRIITLIFDNTQNRRDLLERNGYYCLMCLGNFDFYLQYFRLWWNERIEDQSRLSILHLTTTEE